MLDILILCGFPSLSLWTLVPIKMVSKWYYHLETILFFVLHYDEESPALTEVPSYIFTTQGRICLRDHTGNCPATNKNCFRALSAGICKHHRVIPTMPWDSRCPPPGWGTPRSTARGYGPAPPASPRCRRRRGHNSWGGFRTGRCTTQHPHGH